MSFLSVLLAYMPGFDELISRHWLLQTGDYACFWTLDGISYMKA